MGGAVQKAQSMFKKTAVYTNKLFPYKTHIPYCNNICAVITDLGKTVFQITFFSSPEKAIIFLTNFSLETPKSVTSKKCRRPQSDATECDQVLHCLQKVNPCFFSNIYIA